MNSTTLTIRLDAGLAQALEHEAQHSGQSKGQIAREALQERLSKKPRFSVMRKYAGIMTGPSDLSTNKAYRKNWKPPGK